jgi:type I site-specific restriction endonuclease
VELPVLNFPGYDLKIVTDSIPRQSLKIFDIIRKKYVSLTPEEWVRQHLVHFLVKERKFPLTLLSVEKKILVNRLSRRADIVAYSNSLKPILIAECKSPDVAISQKTFDQAARYNMALGVSFFLFSNGMETICCSIDHENKSYHFLKQIPAYDEIK